MSKLNQKIQDNIRRASTNEVSEKDWENFQQYRNKPTSDKKRFLIPFLAFALFLMMSYAVYLKMEIGAIHKTSNVSLETNSLSSEIPVSGKLSNLPIEESKIISEAQTVISSQQKEQRQEQELNNVVDIKTTPLLAAQLQSNKTNNVQKKNSVNNTFATKILNQSYRQTPITQKTTNQNTINSIRNSITPNYTLDILDNGKTKQLIIDPLSFLPSRINLIPFNEIPTLSFGPLRLAKSNDTNLSDKLIHPWTLGLFAGGTKISYPRVNKANAFSGGVHLGYQIHRSIKIKTFFEMQRRQFASTEGVKELGIRSKEPPNMETSLAEIGLTTLMIQSGVSLLYTFDLSDKVALEFGPGYSIAKELSRDLNYEFEGEQEGENGGNNDNESDDQLLFYSNIFHLESSIQYRIRRTQLFTTLVYQFKNYNSDNKILPKEIKLQIGVKKFF